MSRMLARIPVTTANLDLGGTNVTTSAWVQLVSSMAQPTSAMEIFNGSGSVLQIAKGGSGSEVAIPYLVLPGRSTILPIEVSKTQRLTVKALDATADAGTLAINFFG